MLYEETIVKHGDGYITGKEINFENLQELIRFSRQETINIGQTKCLIFNFAVSTLKLFSKCTTRLVLGHVHVNCTS